MKKVLILNRPLFPSSCRNDVDILERITSYVLFLEQSGCHVLWPHRYYENHLPDDHFQLHPCDYPVTSLQEAEEIHVWYDNYSTPYSQPFYVALGIVLALGKDIVLINASDIHPNNGTVDFKNLLLLVDLRSFLGKEYFKKLSAIFCGAEELLLWLHTQNSHFFGETPIVFIRKRRDTANRSYFWGIINRATLSEHPH